MLKRSACLLGLLAVLYLESAAAAQAPPPAVVPTPAAASASMPDTPARRAAALKLAQSAQTMDTLKFGAIRGFAEAFRHVASQPGELAEIEKRYPGFIDEVIKRGSPVMGREIERVAPDLWRRMADIYVAELTDQELARYTAFYSSPTGSKLMHLINQNADLGEMTDEMEQTGEMSVETHVKAVDKAAAASISAMSAEDLVAILQFNAENKATNERVAPKIMLAVSEWQKQMDNGPLGQEMADIMAKLAVEMAARDQAKK